MRMWLCMITCTLAANSASGEIGPPGTYSAHPAPLDPPTITAQPFFPADDRCWNLNDKFDHPREIVAPRFSYNFFSGSKQSQEATVLVEVNEYGYPTRLAVVSSNSERVAKMMLGALAKSRWWIEPNKNGKMFVWFLYKFFSDKGAWHIAT